MFTTQQLQGGPRYSSKVLVGNWNEDVEIEQIQYKDYLNKREKGEITVHKIQQKLAKSLTKVGFTYSEDSKLRFGNKLMMLNKKTNSFLSCDLGDVVEPNQAFAVTASPTVNGPVARSVFILSRANESDGFPGDELHYGQPFRLQVHYYLSPSPLYLHSCITSPQSFARFSRHQEVSVNAFKGPNTVWLIEHANPKLRFKSQGEVVAANQPIVIKHKQTGQCLAADSINYRNDYGVEFEVCGHSFLNTKKTQQLGSERAGKLTVDNPSRAEGDQNMWMFCTAVDPSQEEEKLPEETNHSAYQLLNQVKQALLQRGTYGIRGLSRLFRVMDDNGNGQLDHEDFKWGLYDAGLYLNDDQVKTLIEHFDRNKDGVVNFDEFLTTIRGPMNDFRMRLVAQAYEKLDKNGDGQITLDDVAQIYDASKHPEVLSGKRSEEDVFREFMSMWDTEKPDGIVTLQEFAKYYEDVSASIDSDQYFEVMMKNAWNL